MIRRGAARLLYGLPVAVCVVCGTALPLLLFINAILRYTGWFALPWIDEVSQILFFWLSLFGASLAVRHRAHFRFTGLVRRLPNGVAYSLDRISETSLLILGVGMLLFGTTIVAGAGNQATPILSIPFTLIYSAVPISGGLVVFYAVVNIRSQHDARVIEKPR